MGLMDIRFLQAEDVPALLELEAAKWEPRQAASSDMLLQRIAAYPALCVGAFCRRTGRAHASLFLRPVDAAMFTGPVQWKDSAALNETGDGPRDTRSLFGLSLSSTRPQAVTAMFAFLYPHLLKAGWRDIYLGSPIPGLRKACENDPALTVWQYVHAKRKTYGDEPIDPQLSYYYKKGFRQIVSIQKDYFPHRESLDYGVILRAPIPLARPAALWRAAPLPLLKGLSRVVFRLA